MAIGSVNAPGAGSAISRPGAPTKETAGIPGQHYYDSEGNREYVCQGREEDGGYIWTDTGDAGQILYNGSPLSEFLEKLEESGLGGSVVIHSIDIAVSPTKTSYLQGEAFDPAGMKVMGKYAISGTVIAEVEVTGYTYPLEGLADGVKEVAITYTEGGNTVKASVPVTVTHRLKSLTVAATPSKTTYEYGDTLDTAGLSVQAEYSDGKTAAVTGWTCTPTTLDTLGAQAVTVRYTENGVTKTASFSVTVARKKLAAVPSQDGSLTYTGAVQSLKLKNFDSSKMVLGGTTTGTDAGSYSASATPGPNYCWPDGSTGAKNISWAIGRAVISAPVVKTNPTYTGSALSPVWDGYDSSKMAIGGTYSSINAGDYNASFTPGPNYCWPDGSVTAKAVSWSIKRAAVAIPTASTSPTYTGSAQSPAWNGYDAAKMTIGGESSAVDAGTHSAVFKLGSNYCWPDGSIADKPVSWVMERAAVAVPTVKTNPTYTGSAQSPAWNGYDADKMTIGGDASKTDAGSYNASFTPDANHKWPDGTTGAKSVAWSIGKAAGSLTISRTTLALDASTTTGTITVTRAGDGAISASSSNTSVATVSVSGNTVTVTGKANGSATITIKVAAGTNYTAPTDKTCSVTVTFTRIYGASWDGTSTTKWTRTDDAAGFVDPVPYVKGASSYSSPFDNRKPWSGMVKSERTAGTMVAIPKFWYKITQNGAGMKIQIADNAVSGFSVAPAHMNRGDGKGERSVVYIGRYHCGATAWKSATGQLPKVNITRATARTEIHNLGTNIWQMDFAMRFTLWLLYIVEFADWNSQAKIGYGCGSNSGLQAMGASDSMPYHTGTMQTARTTYGVGVQYRNIEGLWDNCFDWCDGCYSSSNGLMIILNPNSFSDTTGGVSVGTPSSGFPSAFSVKSVSGLFAMFIPTAASGSEMTYSCDDWHSSTAAPCVCVGGFYITGGYYGLFCVNANGLSGTGNNHGARSQELP